MGRAKLLLSPFSSAARQAERVLFGIVQKSRCARADCVGSPGTAGASPYRFLFGQHALFFGHHSNKKRGAGFLLRLVFLNFRGGVKVLLCPDLWAVPQHRPPFIYSTTISTVSDGPATPASLAATICTRNVCPAVRPVNVNCVS